MKSGIPFFKSGVRVCQKPEIVVTALRAATCNDDGNDPGRACREPGGFSRLPAMVRWLSSNVIISGRRAGIIFSAYLKLKQKE
jgi:hypothetical protein